MPSAVFSVDELLAAMRHECTVAGIHERLGGRDRCHRSTVWRALGRAEQTGLVERSEALDTQVWEPTGKGRAPEIWTLTDDGRSSAAGELVLRPPCPSCGSKEGTRLESTGGQVKHGQLRCRWCGHRWRPSATDRAAAEKADAAVFGPWAGASWS